jgi:adenylate cyclase
MQRRQAWFLVAAPLIGALAGLLFWFIFSEVGTPIGSVVRGILVGTLILYYERGLLLPRWRNRIRRAATPLFALVTLATYAAMIVIGNVAAGFVLHHGFKLMESTRAAIMLTQSGFLYALCASAIVIFVLRVRDLIGPSVFFNLLLGLYHRPIAEERIFLFIDIVGSTAFAARHGDLATQSYLGRFFETLALPVRRWDGSIDEYVGDMAMVTWPIARGAKNAACLRCVFEFEAAIRREAAEWERCHGEVPRFRAALHCGPVVTAEIGLDRHKIAYFGDVVNATARLEALSKRLDRSVLASSNLLAQIGRLPSDLTSDDLGTHAMRGRDEPLRVAAIAMRAVEPATSVRPRTRGIKILLRQILRWQCNAGPLVYRRR